MKLALLPQSHGVGRREINESPRFHDCGTTVEIQEIWKQDLLILTFDQSVTRPIHRNVNYNGWTAEFRIYITIVCVKNSG